MGSDLEDTGLEYDLEYEDRVRLVKAYYSLGGASLNAFRVRWELYERDRRVHGLDKRHG
jgi:hypothetical protein